MCLETSFSQTQLGIVFLTTGMVLPKGIERMTSLLRTAPGLADSMSLLRSLMQVQKSAHHFKGTLRISSLLCGLQCSRY